MKVTFEIYGKQEGISSSRRIQLISKNADGAITSFRELSATGLGSNLIQVSDRNKHNTTQITTEEASRLINIAVENNDIYIIQHKKDKIKIEYAYFCNVGTIDQKLRHLLTENIIIAPNGDFLFLPGECGEWSFTEKGELLYQEHSLGIWYTKDEEGLLCLRFKTAPLPEQIYESFSRDLMDIFIEKTSIYR